MAMDSGAHLVVDVDVQHGSAAPPSTASAFGVDGGRCLHWWAWVIPGPLVLVSVCPSQLHHPTIHHPPNQAQKPRDCIVTRIRPSPVASQPAQPQELSQPGRVLLGRGAPLTPLYPRVTRIVV